MDNLPLPPRLNAALNEFYTASEPDPAFAERLEADLRRRQNQFLPTPAFNRQRMNFMQTLRAKPVFAILFVLLALALLTGIAYAVGRLSGFIPGFGFVSDASTARVLEAPAEVSENGITFRVERSADDSTRFWVEMSLSRTPYPEAIYDALIKLPDGTIIKSQQAGWHESLSQEVPCLFEFPALPPESEMLTIQLSYAHIRQDDWTTVSIPFKLRALRRDEIVPAQPTDNTARESTTQDGLTLVLDNVAPASNKTILQVSLRFDQPQTWLNSDWTAMLSDTSGRLYPLTDITPEVSDGNTKTFETVPFASQTDLILSLSVFPDSHNLPLSVDFSDKAQGFRFDPGADPQVGQTWQLDETLHADKYKVHLIGAKLISPNKINFEFETADNLSGVMLYSDKASSASAGDPLQSEHFTAGLTLKSFPSEPFEVKMTRISYTAHGDWQIHWQAPAAPLGIEIESTPVPVATTWVYATPTLRSSDPLALEVQALTQKFAAPFQQGPGWIHWQSESTHRQSAGREHLPTYLVNEQWFEIDASGYVLRSLYIDRDKEGNIIQQVAMVGNYSMNFTTGDSGFNNGSQYHFSSDTLTQSLADAALSDAEVTREEATCEDGSACLVISILSHFPQPITNTPDDPPIYGSGQRFWINLATGQQVKSEVISLQGKDSQVINDTYKTLLLEKVDTPPQEILETLNRIVVP